MQTESNVASGKQAANQTEIASESTSRPEKEHGASANNRRPVHPLRRTRSIVGDILTLQLVFATLLGLLAIGGLWVISNAVIQDNLEEWAQTWVKDLGELGAPLYQFKDDERFLRVESYAQKFPEIAFVRYYTRNGEILFATTSRTSQQSSALPPLKRDQLDRLRATADSHIPFMVDTSMETRSLIRVSAPVWIESMKPEELLSLDLDATPSKAPNLIGFVELGLDFSRYEERLVHSIILGSIILAAALLLLALAGRHFVRRAIKPLSELELPLARLAAGETEVQVRSTGHKEIVAINHALQTTIHALNERDKILRRLADYDPLTGLPNRRYFTQALEDEIVRAVASNRSSALLFVDLDQFKCINDTLGHAAGDRVLVQAANCLQGSLREHDLIARFGGDEFTIILKDITRDNAVRLVDTLVRIMQDIHFLEDGQSLNVLCSVGITIIDSGGFTPDELLSQADIACHEAKACGRNRSCFYEVSSEEKGRMTADISWSQRIKSSLKNDDFLLHYQPIIELASREPLMYEALVRMRGDEGEIIPPAVFLPAANRFGLMVDIDHMVIRKAFASLSGFRQRGLDLRFTLNLSGYVFNDTKLIGFIEEQIRENQLDPSAVVLEITEQVAVRHLGQAGGLIRDLMAIGCRFALDDFGTGFSSFNYLKHLPVDYIKIDGSFVSNMANDRIDQAMVKSIIQVAKTVGKQTIAEFVQNEETLQMLRDLGVDYAQGYYLGKPSAALLHEVQDVANIGVQEIRWHDFQNDVAQLCISWYSRNKLSYRQLEALMLERGLPVSHTTIHRWIRSHTPPAGESPQASDATPNMTFRVVERFIKLKGQRKFLYLAIDPQGAMVDFVLNNVPTRDAAALFFRNHVPGSKLDFSSHPAPHVKAH
jgi:diguanylate cyclase (GGDEF)-like protein